MCIALWSRTPEHGPGRVATPGDGRATARGAKRQPSSPSSAGAPPASVGGRRTRAGEPRGHTMITLRIPERTDEEAGEHGRYPRSRATERRARGDGPRERHRRPRRRLLRGDEPPRSRAASRGGLPRPALHSGAARGRRPGGARAPATGPARLAKHPWHVAVERHREDLLAQANEVLLRFVHPLSPEVSPTASGSRSPAEPSSPRARCDRPTPRRLDFEDIGTLLGCPALLATRAYAGGGRPGGAPPGAAPQARRRRHRSPRPPSRASRRRAARRRGARARARPSPRAGRLRQDQDARQPGRRAGTARRRPGRHPAARLQPQGRRATRGASCRAGHRHDAAHPRRARRAAGCRPLRHVQRLRLPLPARDRRGTHRPRRRRVRAARPDEAGHGGRGRIAGGAQAGAGLRPRRRLPRGHDSRARRSRGAGGSGGPHRVDGRTSRS